MRDDIVLRRLPQQYPEKRRRTNQQSDVERRAIRASLVQLGELSSGRQALEGQIWHPVRSELGRNSPIRSAAPPHPREPLPADLLTFQTGSAFELDERKFSQNLRSFRRGAAPGPSGMSAEHLRPVLEAPRVLHSFFRVAESLATAQVPQEVVDGLRLGRITALRKPTGGVRGIVAGDIIRRLVGRTIAQQLGPAVERATSPFQYALSARAGCECVAHALQALCETNPQSTVLSIDGVSTFDLISRGAMMQGLREVKKEALPFVRLFYGQPSTYLWEDDDNIVHSIPQGEGGEQGDPLMPLLFSLGQHRALQAVAAQLQDGEKLFAFLDDIYVVCPRPDMFPVHAIIHP